MENGSDQVIVQIAAYQVTSAMVEFPNIFRERYPAVRMMTGEFDFAIQDYKTMRSIVAAYGTEVFTGSGVFCMTRANACRVLEKLEPHLTAFKRKKKAALEQWERTVRAQFDVPAFVGKEHEFQIHIARAKGCFEMMFCDVTLVGLANPRVHGHAMTQEFAVAA